jgi:hypothetical protein
MGHIKSNAAGKFDSTWSGNVFFTPNGSATYYMQYDSGSVATLNFDIIASSYGTNLTLGSAGSTMNNTTTGTISAPHTLQNPLNYNR